MNVVSVICRPPDRYLHLAPYEPGLGTEVHTLCLERWTRHEQCREDSEFCPKCFEKWKSGNQPQESKQ